MQWKQKSEGIVILILDEIDFKAKILVRYIDGH